MTLSLFLGSIAAICVVAVEIILFVRENGRDHKKKRRIANRTVMRCVAILGAVCAFGVTVQSGLAARSQAGKAEIAEQQRIQLLNEQAAMREDLPALLSLRKSIRDIQEMEVWSQTAWLHDDLAESQRVVDKMASLIANLERSAGYGSLFAPLLVNYSYRHSANQESDKAVALLELALQIAPASLVVKRDLANALTCGQAPRVADIARANAIMAELLDGDVPPELASTVYYSAAMNVADATAHGVNTIAESQLDLLRRARDMLRYLRDPDATRPAVESALYSAQFRSSGALVEKHAALRRQRSLLGRMSYSSTPLRYYEVAIDYMTNVLYYVDLANETDQVDNKLVDEGISALATMLSTAESRESLLPIRSWQRVHQLSVILMTKANLIPEADFKDGGRLSVLIEKHRDRYGTKAEADMRFGRYARVAAIVDSSPFEGRDRIAFIADMLDATIELSDLDEKRQCIVALNLLETVAFVFLDRTRNAFHGERAAQALQMTIDHYFKKLDEIKTKDQSIGEVIDYFDNRIRSPLRAAATQKQDVNGGG